MQPKSTLAPSIELVLSTLVERMNAYRPLVHVAAATVVINRREKYPHLLRLPIEFFWIAQQPCPLWRACCPLLFRTKLLFFPSTGFPTPPKPTKASLHHDLIFDGIALSVSPWRGIHRPPEPLQTHTDHSVLKIRCPSLQCTTFPSLSISGA